MMLRIIAGERGSLDEYAGLLDHIVLSPASSSVDAGYARTFAAEGFDRYGHSLGDVTADTTFSMSGSGFCVGADCGSMAPGDYTVTGIDAGLVATASLHVDPGVLDRLVLTPHSSTITTDGSQVYAVEGFDAYDNSLGDLTGSTIFWMSGAGSCSENVCRSGVPGDYSVTADNGGVQDSATVHVEVGVLSHIVVTPGDAILAAGETQPFTVSGYDSSFNLLGDVTSSTEFTVSGGGFCSADGCGSYLAGDYTVTATDGLLTTTAVIHVGAAALDHIRISPSSSTITTDGTQSYTAEGLDAYGNTLGDVTLSTAFSISGSGACVGSACGSAAPGDYTVFADAGGHTASASLHVDAGALDHIVISSAAATTTTDTARSFTAEGFDRSDNSIGDVTAATVFAMSGGGTCTGSECGAHTPGDYIVTGTHGVLTGTASLHVDVGALASITITPADGTITVDDSQAYAVEGFDQFGNSRGDVTGSVIFAISGSGSCSANECRSSEPGDLTVTAVAGGIEDTASLHVTVGRLSYLILVPGSGSIAAGGTQTYTAQGFDQFNHNLGDVTASATFAMSGPGSCTANACSAIVAGDYTVTAEYDGATGSAFLRVGLGTLTSIAIGPVAATITADDVQSYSATGHDVYGNIADVTGSTVFTIDVGAECTGSVCHSVTPGGYTVTATNGTLTDTTLLTVTPGTLSYVVVGPDDGVINAGGTQPFTAEAFDSHGNSLGDVTGATIFAIGGGGSCAAAVCQTTVAGDHSVSGTWSGVTDTAVLHVEAGPLDRIAVAPDGATITADESRSFTAEGLDVYGNSLGDLTSETVFEMAGGSCADAVCASTVAGDHTVTGVYGDLSDTATLHVSIGALASIVIGPRTATITAGGTQAYTATGFDAHGNSIDVAGSTIFSVTGGSCVGSSCSATAAGDHAVTATKGLLTDAAALQVDAGPLDHLSISPGFATITAGETWTYAATGHDSFDNSLGDVTGSTIFAISGGSCAAATCTTTASGDHTVTGTIGTRTGMATLHVDAGTLQGIVISPKTATVAAGESQAYTAEGFDIYQNSLGDVTGSTILTIAGEGSCADSLCTSTVTGDYAVVGSNGGFADTATLHVAIGTLTSIVVGPSAATITAGGTQAYTAVGFDAYANSADVTGAAVFSIAGGGSCTAATCGSTAPGDHPVTAAMGLLTDTATLHVDAGALHHLAVSPGTADVTAGGSQAYTAEGFDAFDNSLGDVTAATVFTIGGVACAGASCASTVAGDHTVAATNGAATGTAMLHVDAGALDGIIVDPDGNTITAGGTQSFSAEAFDSYGNSLGDVTSTTVFTISGDGSCTDSVCGSTVQGDHTVFGTYGAFSDSATLHVNAGAPTSIAISPLMATITAGTTQRFTTEGFDDYFNSVGDVTASTVFTIDSGTSCPQATCTGAATGDHIVTGTYGSMADTATLHVNVGPPHHYIVTGLPATMIPSSTGTVTVRVLDSAGNVSTGYTGTVHFTSSDGAAVLPADYTFVAGDHGAHTFTAGVTLRTEGTQSVTASDTATATISGTRAGIVVGYASTTYHPISPARILDSRPSGGVVTNIGLTGTFASGTVRTLQVVNANYVGGGSAVAVPAGATAITGNLTVVGQTAAGVLALGPTMTSTGDTSTLNFVVGDIRANNVTVGLSVDGSLQIVYRAASGATTNVVFDVTGYFTSDSAGGTYHPVDPGRVLDTRPSGGSVVHIGLTGKFASGVVRTVNVAGVVGLNWTSALVPQAAVAVSGNVTVVGAATGGHLCVGPTLTSAPPTSALNLNAGQTRANGVTVALAGGKVQIVWVGNTPTSSVDVILDITGYFTPDGTGLSFHPVVPARVLNSAANVGLVGPFSHNVGRTMVIQGLGQVPTGAAGIAGNLTLVAPSSGGYCFVAPSLSGTPKSSTINTSAGVTAANGFDVALDGAGQLTLIWEGAAGSTANLQLDITGYWQ